MRTITLLAFTFLFTFAAWAGSATLLQPTAEKAAMAETPFTEGANSYLNGSYPAAEKHFRNAVKKVPDSGVAHYNLALSLHEQGKHTEAKEHFIKAKELEPDNRSIAGSDVLKMHLKM